MEADVKAEESREAGPSLLPNLISEESRPGSLRIFDVKDPQLRERSGTFQLFELPSQTQQLATPNHNTHTHTQSVTVCDYIPAIPAVVTVDYTQTTPPRSHPAVILDYISATPRSHSVVIFDYTSTTPAVVNPADTYHVVSSSL